MAKAYHLEPGQTISVTVNEGRAQHVRTTDGLENAFTRSSVAFGPYLNPREFLIDGEVSVTLADYSGSRAEPAWTAIADVTP